MHYFCPKCGEVYDFSRSFYFKSQDDATNLTCPMLDCNGSLKPVDKAMAPIIEQLFEAGFSVCETYFSNKAYPKYFRDVPTISFTIQRKIDDKGFCDQMIALMRSLPAPWVIRECFLWDEMESKQFAEKAEPFIADIKRHMAKNGGKVNWSTASVTFSPSIPMTTAFYTHTFTIAPITHYGILDTKETKEKFEELTHAVYTNFLHISEFIYACTQEAQNPETDKLWKAIKKGWKNLIAQRDKAIYNWQYFLDFIQLPEQTSGDLTQLYKKQAGCLRNANNLEALVLLSRNLPTIKESLKLVKAVLATDDCGEVKTDNETEVSIDPSGDCSSCIFYTSVYDPYNQLKGKGYHNFSCTCPIYDNDALLDFYKRYPDTDLLKSETQKPDLEAIATEFLGEEN